MTLIRQIFKMLITFSAKHCIYLKFSFAYSVNLNSIMFSMYKELNCNVHLYFLMLEYVLKLFTIQCTKGVVGAFDSFPAGWHADTTCV